MILVTGGTGLVGSHLLLELVKQSKRIRAIVRNKSKIELVKRVFSYYTDKPEEFMSNIEWIESDMLDLVSLDKAFFNVKQVYHCAAIVSIGGKSRKDLINANVIGTENIVNMCLTHQVEKLCHVSSIASLGNSLNGELIDENTAWTVSKNHSAYSISKFKSEMEVWRGIQEGLNAVIVNPSVIIGPGFWYSGSSSLFTKVAKGMKYYTSGSTGFVDVRDVSDSMIKLMESDIQNERFIISSENLNYKELFENISRVIGVKSPRKEASERLLRIAVIFDSIASILRIKKKEITKSVVRASLSKSNYSNNKIKEAIEKTFISINDSIADTADKFKKELTIS